MDKVKIYNKLGQLVGWYINGMVQVYSPDLQKAKTGYKEGEDLIEYLKGQGFRFE